MHGFHGRVVADVPVDGRRVVVSVRLRRLVCPVLGCPRQTFREQVPSVVERYQRRTYHSAGQLGSMVKELPSRRTKYFIRAADASASRVSARGRGLGPMPGSLRCGAAVKRFGEVDVEKRGSA